MTEHDRALLLAFRDHWWASGMFRIAPTENALDAFLATRAQPEARRAIFTDEWNPERDVSVPDSAQPDEPRTELPPELEAVFRDPDVRLVGEESALKRATDYVIAQSKAAAALVYKDVLPATTMNAQPEAPEPLPSLQEMYGNAARLAPKVREFLATDELLNPKPCPHGCPPGECAECDGGSGPEVGSEQIPVCPFCRGTKVETRDGDSPMVPVIWWCLQCDRKVLPPPAPPAERSALQDMLTNDCPKCGKPWTGVYQRDADTIMCLCNRCGAVNLVPTTVAPAGGVK